MDGEGLTNLGGMLKTWNESFTNVRVINDQLAAAQTATPETTSAENSGSGNSTPGNIAFKSEGPIGIAPERLSSRLRTATRAEHDSLETVVPLMSTTMNNQEYGAYLQCLWPLYQAIEYQTEMAQPTWFEDMGLARRLPLLSADLASLGLRAPDTAFTHSLMPSLDRHEQRLGMYYVLEGSSLGAKVIRKHLSSNGVVNVDASAQFFDPYGDRMMPTWLSFKAAIDHYTDNEAASALIIESAKQTFECYENWLRRSGYPQLR